MRKRETLTGNAEELAKEMRKRKESGEYRRIQCVYLALMYPDMSAKEIGKITQFSESRVWSIHTEYRKNGIEGFIDKRGGRYRENLTTDEELALLNTFEEQIHCGKSDVVKDIKQVYEEKVGKEVAQSTIYRMLARHGFKKNASYPNRPKSSQGKQKAMKTVSRYAQSGS